MRSTASTRGLLERQARSWSDGLCRWQSSWTGAAEARNGFPATRIDGLKCNRHITWPMSILKPEKLDRIIERFRGLEGSLAAGAEGDSFVKLSKEYAELQPLAQTAEAYRKSLGEREDLKEMIAGGGEMGAMAEAEKAVLDQKIDGLEQKLKVLL